MNIELEVLLRVLLAFVLGGAVGFERQRWRKPAGLRTHMLVAGGAAVFAGAGLIIQSQAASVVGPVQFDLLRVVAAVVTGVGFLGAGAIFTERGSVVGLTTAAGIWVTAGIGLVAGLGMYILAVGATVLAVVVIAIASDAIVPEPSERSGDVDGADRPD